jgi:hypothetical protein
LPLLQHDSLWQHPRGKAEGSSASVDIPFSLAATRPALGAASAS